MREKGKATEPIGSLARMAVVILGPTIRDQFSTEEARRQTGQDRNLWFGPILV